LQNFRDCGSAAARDNGMKDQKQLIAFLLSHGWRMIPTPRHLKLLPPFINGGLVVMSRTPSDHRAIFNMISDVRRCYRKVGRESPL